MRSPILSLAAWLLAALLPASGAEAGEMAVVPGLSFAYEEQEGLCRLEPERDGREDSLYRMLVAADEAHLATLAIFYDCAFVDALRAGGRVEPAEWVKLSATKTEGELRIFALSRRAFVQEITPVFEKQMGGYSEGGFDDFVAEANARFDEAVSQSTPGAEAPQLNEVEPLGLLDASPDALYFALLALVSQGETQDRILTVGATTLIRGYIVNVYVSRPFGGGGSPDPLLGRTRAFVTDLIARNDPTGEAPPEAAAAAAEAGDGDNVYVEAAVIGVVILVLGLLAVTYVSRRKS